MLAAHTRNQRLRPGAQTLSTAGYMPLTLVRGVANSSNTEKLEVQADEEVSEHSVVREQTGIEHRGRDLRGWLEECMNYVSGPRPRLRISSQLTISCRWASSHGIAVRIEFGNSKGSSLNKELLHDMTATFDSLAMNDKVHTVVVSSNRYVSTAFCGGADVGELASIRSPEDARIFISRITRLCTSIRNFPGPVIAVIDGPCIGAGLEMAVSCDIRVATDLATFSMPEVRLGIPSVVEARLLCDIMGWGRARHLMLTGQPINADVAFRSGLTTMSFQDRGAMVKWATNYAKACSGKNAEVYKQQKLLMRRWEDSNLETGIALGINSFASTFQSGENKIKERASAITEQLRTKKARSTPQNVEESKGQMPEKDDPEV